MDPPPPPSQQGRGGPGPHPAPLPDARRAPVAPTPDLGGQPGPSGPSGPPAASPPIGQLCLSMAACLGGAGGAGAGPGPGGEADENAAPSPSPSPHKRQRAHPSPTAHAALTAAVGGGGDGVAPVENGETAALAAAPPSPPAGPAGPSGGAGAEPMDAAADAAAARAALDEEADEPRAGGQQPPAHWLSGVEPYFTPAQMDAVVARLIAAGKAVGLDAQPAAEPPPLDAVADRADGPFSRLFCEQVRCGARRTAVQRACGRVPAAARAAPSLLRQTPDQRPGVVFVMDAVKRAMDNKDVAVEAPAVPWRCRCLPTIGADTWSPLLRTLGAAEKGIGILLAGGGGDTTYVAELCRAVSQAAGLVSYVATHALDPTADTDTATPWMVMEWVDELVASLDAADAARVPAARSVRADWDGARQSVVDFLERRVAYLTAASARVDRLRELGPEAGDDFFLAAEGVLASHPDAVLYLPVGMAAGLVARFVGRPLTLPEIRACIHDHAWADLKLAAFSDLDSAGAGASDAGAGGSGAGEAGAGADGSVLAVAVKAEAGAGAGGGADAKGKGKAKAGAARSAAAAAAAAADQKTATARAAHMFESNLYHSYTGFCGRYWNYCVPSWASFHGQPMYGSSLYPDAKIRDQYVSAQAFVPDSASTYVALQGAVFSHYLPHGDRAVGALVTRAEIASYLSNPRFGRRFDHLAADRGKNSDMTTTLREFCQSKLGRACDVWRKPPEVPGRRQAVEVIGLRRRLPPNVGGRPRGTA